jgi:hypothetical protein
MWQSLARAFNGTQSHQQWPASFRPFPQLSLYFGEPYTDKGGFILGVGAGFERDAALLSVPLSACLAAYFSPDPDLIPSCHSSNRLRSRQ